MSLKALQTMMGIQVDDKVYTVVRKLSGNRVRISDGKRYKTISGSYARGTKIIVSADGVKMVGAAKGVFKI